MCTVFTGFFLRVFLYLSLPTPYGYHYSQHEGYCWRKDMTQGMATLRGKCYRKALLHRIFLEFVKVLIAHIGSLQLTGLQPTSLLCHGNSPGKNVKFGSLSISGDILNQESSPVSPHEIIYEHIKEAKSQVRQ